MCYVSEFLNSFERVICLSLPSSRERREHISHLTDQYDVISFQFFDATSTKDEPVRAYYEKGLVKTFPPCFRCGKYECDNDLCNNTLIPPQVATFISYLRLWQHIEEKGYEYVLIIEDDIKLTGLAESVCESFLKGDWLSKSGILSTEPMLLRFGWALCADHQLETPFSFISDIKMSNPCHAINSAMAKHLLSSFSKIETTVDIYQHKLCATSITAKTAIPPIFYEMSWSTGEFDSLIHPKQKRLDYLAEKGMKDSPEYIASKQRLESHCAHTLFRPILSIGHPGCGSGYTAALLQGAGLNVGHDKMESDGISSWMFAVYDDNNPYALNSLANSRFFTYFKTVIHHVRDPRDAIYDIIQHNAKEPKSLEFRRKHIKSQFNIDICAYSSKLESAIASLVFWNKIIELQEPGFVYRVETGESGLFEILSKAILKERISAHTGSPLKGSMKQQPNAIGVLNNTSILESKITEIEPCLLALLNEHCLKYDYIDF